MLLELFFLLQIQLVMLIILQHLWFLSTTCFATFITNVLNSSFFATKSVSEFTSTTAPILPSSDI